MAQNTPSHLTDDALRARIQDASQPRHLRELAALTLDYVALEDRVDVSLGAGRMSNMTGCRYSDAFRSEVSAYRLDRAAWKAARERDRENDRRAQELERAIRFRL